MGREGRGGKRKWNGAAPKKCVRCEARTEIPCAHVLGKIPLRSCTLREVFAVGI